MRWSKVAARAASAVATLPIGQDGIGANREGVDAGQPGLLLDQPAGGGGGEEGVTGAVALGAPVAVPAGVDQHGSASNVVGGQRVAVDRASSTDPHHDAVEVGDA